MCPRPPQRQEDALVRDACGRRGWIPTRQDKAFPLLHQHRARQSLHHDFLRALKGGCRQDGGVSWSTPMALAPDMLSAQPRAVVLDNGALREHSNTSICHHAVV